MKHILFLWGFLICFSNVLTAQRLQLDWVEYEYKYPNFFVVDIFSDSSFLYIGGEVRDTADFNFSNLSYSYTVNGSFDAYWGKYRKSDFTLEDIFIIAGPDSDFISDITVDKSGNMYICCMSYSSVLDIAPLVTDTFIINSYGGKDIIIAKYNPTGQLLWARHIGGATSSDHGNEIRLDEDGNLFVVGNVSGNVWIDSTATHIIQRTAGYSSPFIAKYDSTGVLQWINMLNANFAYVIDIAINNQKTVTFAGSLIDSVNLGNEWFASDTPTSFLAIADSNGAVLWGDTLEGSLSSTQKVLIDDEYVYFVTNHGDNKINFAKYDFWGNRIFQKSLFCTGMTDVRGFTFQDSSLLLFGMFSDTIYFDSIQMIPNYLITNGDLYFDIFTVSCDKNGNWQWIERTVSSDSATGGAFVSSVLIDESSIYLGLDISTINNNALINIAFSPSDFQVPESKAVAKYNVINTGLIQSAKDNISYLKLYPNPTQNMLMLQSGQTISHVIIYDLAGRPIQEENWYGVPISLSGLASGVYIVVAYNQNGQLCGSEKLIKLDSQ
jgi:hypothetical protein